MKISNVEILKGEERKGNHQKIVIKSPEFIEMSYLNDGDDKNDLFYEGKMWIAT